RLNRPVGGVQDDDGDVQMVDGARHTYDAELDVSSFETKRGKPALKCNLKANEAYLYPLYPAAKCFLSLFKPSVHIPFADIDLITFQRVSASGGGTGGKMFDVVIELKKGGNVSYGQIQREDYEPLLSFARSRGIRVKAEKVSDYANYADAMAAAGSESDDEEEEVPAKTMLGDFGGEDEDESVTVTEDEDFDPNAKPVDEDGQPVSESEDSESSEDESGGDSEDESPAKKVPKEKSSKDKPAKEKSSTIEKSKDKGKDKGKPTKTAKGEKKSRKKKDPNEPKKPLSSFMLFSNEKREQVKRDNPSAGFGELGRLLGVLWKEMSKDAKEPYERRAAEAKAKYAKDKAAYDAGLRASASGGSASAPVSSSKKSSTLSAERVDSDSDDAEDDE
ncbi:FACT complex subunit, partial [Gonapodya sp. JEL0774]